ncbi:MAG: ribonuclease M5 [Tissierellia bacterium]|nr:ribonuclease M5 [Tissierellia bacterium]
MIKEVIVVEGRDDLIKVKQAVDCEAITTHGFGFGEKLLNELKEIEKARGLIILTDPDYEGKRIRKRIEDFIPTAKHAFIEREDASRKGNIGVENASAEEIRRAIERARPVLQDVKETFTKGDLFSLGLIGGPNSAEKRNRLSKILKIGHVNGKSLHSRLNSFGITREELVKAMEEIENE